MKQSIHTHTTLVMLTIAINFKCTASLQAAPTPISSGPMHNTIEAYSPQWMATIRELLHELPTMYYAYKSHRACVNASREELFYALLEAAKQNLHDVIRHLVHCGASVNGQINHTYGYTPLMIAALYGQYAAAKMLIDYGADVNAQNPSGETALMKACGDTFCSTQEAASMVRFLLQRGADAIIADNDGNSALHCALTKQSDDNCRIAQLLYDLCPADPVAANNNETHLLDHPALFNKARALMWLITHGAHINASKTYESPLLYTYAQKTSAAYYNTSKPAKPLQMYLDLVDELAQRGGCLSLHKQSVLHPRVCTRINKARKQRLNTLETYILDYTVTPGNLGNVPDDLYRLIGQFAGECLNEKV